MCGIAGFYQFWGDPVTPSVLERMVRSLAHRGPDDFGHVTFDKVGRPVSWKTEAAPLSLGRVAMGNHRLKIIDLSPSGHQPMSTPDGALSLVYNGEIYNYLELRAELVKKGCVFRSQSDSEVILHAYAIWGVDCFRRFNGMWAMALFDSRDGTMVLSRDRWGVKPLYVFRDGGLLAFGSEVKALLCHPAIPRRPNGQTIYNYVARHYRLVDGGSGSFFDKIEHFPSSSYWIVRPDGRIHTERFWALDPTHVEKTVSDAEAVERFKNLFTDAVQIRLRSDVPVACMLSGGLDSSSVTCVAAGLSNSPVTTFSARYVERDFDEGLYIEPTVRHIAASSHSIYPRAVELLETLDTMLSFHDEPVCTVTWFAHWLVLKEVAGMGFPVLLNGHGGDELFAGYWGHYLYHFADLEKSDPTAFRAEYEKWMENHKRDPKEYARFKSQLGALERGELLAADQYANYAHVVAEPFRERHATPLNRPDPFAERGYLASCLYRDIAYEAIPPALRPEDRNSMAFSIETRSPFLDYRLAEFAFALPGHCKIRNGLGKWILREGMKGILPEPVRMRFDKQGFNAPTIHWFRGRSGEAVRSVLSSSSLARRGILDQAAVLRCFDEHQTGKANHYMAIWQWLNLELWMRKFFDEPADARVFPSPH